MIKISKKELFPKLEGLSDNQVDDKLKEPDYFTDDEKEFLRIIRSNAPELGPLQGKLSVCLEVEVETLEENLIVYSYRDDKVKILAPKNPYKTVMALEDGLTPATAEICRQGCVSINDRIISAKEFEKVEVDKLSLIVKIANKFFFQVYPG